MGAGVPTGIGAGVKTVVLPSIESPLELPVVGVDASVGSRVGGGLRDRRRRRVKGD